MVCVLREVRPFFSSGDAMWCLLICDMNVAHACAMDEDSLNTFNKDPIPENAPVASSVQSSPQTSSSSVQSTPEKTLSSLPPATNMPAFNKNAIPFLQIFAPTIKYHNLNQMLLQQHSKNHLVLCLWMKTMTKKALHQQLQSSMHHLLSQDLF